MGPPPMSDEDQADYEKTVMENIKKFSADSLLNAVTCCITKSILRDPGSIDFECISIEIFLSFSSGSC
jgi:hypothetical protein